jgi:hypothetical protein
VRQTAIMLAAITTVLVVASPSSFAARSRPDSGGKVRVRIAGANNGQDVRNGGVSGVASSRRRARSQNTDPSSSTAQ